jgi:hypothetical protein
MSKWLKCVHVIHKQISYIAEIQQQQQQQQQI